MSISPNVPNPQESYHYESAGTPRWIAVLFGLLFAAIAVVVAESSDSNIRDIRDLPTFGDSPVLASIPTILTARDRRRRRLVFASWAAAYALGIGAVSLTVVHALN